jgi:hypothetical protein
VAFCKARCHVRHALSNFKKPTSPYGGTQQRGVFPPLPSSVAPCEPLHQLPPHDSAPEPANPLAY